MAIRKEKNGTYSVDVNMGNDIFKNRIRKRKFGIKTYHKAQEIEAEYVRERKKVLKSKKLNLSKEYSYIDSKTQYFYECEHGSEFVNKLQSTTIRSKKSIFKYHFDPYFKNLMMDDFNTDTIIAFKDALNKSKKEDGSSYKSEGKRKIYKQLTAFLEWCLAKQIIDYNPASNIKNFEYIKEERIVPTIEEVITISQKVADNSRNSLIISLLFTCGLRVGELLALTIPDIHICKEDYNQSYISINKEYVEGTIVNRTKTDESNADVYLDKHTAIKLETYLLELKERYGNNYTSFIFPSFKSKCGVISDTSVRDIIKKARIEGGIEKNITPHKFRHATASILKSQGAQLDDIKSRLRHTDIRTTSNLYGTLYVERKVETAKSINQISSILS